jgi:hypothetical protein
VRELLGYFNYWWPCDRLDSDNRHQIYSDTDSTLGLSLESIKGLFVASDSEEHTMVVS